MAASVLSAVLLVGCGATVAPSASPNESPSLQPGATGDAVAPSASTSTPAAPGGVEPAPGSDSAVYGPNPGAVVVAIDPGHGGCLDWGVPDPSERGEELAEKTMTLAIGVALRERLEAEGVTVVMTRDEDVALAGDHHPELGCEGPPWRDVNGDGEAGFDPEGATRTRDELQARLDLANVTRADALVSIHINSPFDAGQPVEVAFTETFYTDETPWGEEHTARLAAAVQDGIVAELAALAEYERGDRGITAHNFYLVAPTLFEPSAERPDPVKQPTRNGLMPTVLTEVGSITLRAEHDLLASAAGQSAVADGIMAGLVAFFDDRPLAARVGLDGETMGAVPDPVAGDGPPFWPPVVDEDTVRLRITNTGSAPIPAGGRLVAGWEPSEGPYLARPPEELVEVAEALPPLEPGESTAVDVTLPAPPEAERAVAWISLVTEGDLVADVGSPPLQLLSRTP